MRGKSAHQKVSKPLKNKENPVVSMTTGFFKAWSDRRGSNPQNNG
jgi:hypothetical protein